MKPESIVGSYFDYLLRSGPYVSEYVCRSTGIRNSRLRLYPDQFFKMNVLLPPIAEQRQIAEWISAETAGLTRQIHRAQREIDLIREYHERLLSDVVTGQLDVRQIAVGLPAEAETPDGAGDVDFAEEPEELLEAVETNE